MKTIMEPVNNPISETESTKRCPYCAEKILAAAVKCRYCGEFLDRPAPPPPPVHSKSSGVKWYQSNAAVILALLTLGPLALPMVWVHPKYSLAVKAAVTVGMIALTIFLCWAAAAMYQNMMNQINALGL